MDNQESDDWAKIAGVLMGIAGALIIAAAILLFGFGYTSGPRTWGFAVGFMGFFVFVMAMFAGAWSVGTDTTWMDEK